MSNVVALKQNMPTELTDDEIGAVNGGLPSIAVMAAAAAIVGVAIAAFNAGYALGKDLAS